MSQNISFLQKLLFCVCINQLFFDVFNCSDFSRSIIFSFKYRPISTYASIFIDYLLQFAQYLCILLRYRSPFLEQIYQG